MSVTVRKRVTGLALALLVPALLLPAARAGEPVDGTVIRDLYYGDVLFHFYSGDHFAALTHLLSARSTGRVTNHDAESELLLGGLYLHYGQHRRAEELFTRLLTSESSPPVRDRAWFFLGKIRYQRGLNEEALDAFARIDGHLPKSLAAELPMLTAQAHMAEGRFDEAAALLDAWRGPDDWMPYARYNLGVAQVRGGKLAAGIRQLDIVGRGSGTTAEQADLRDKANLALGYAYLQDEQEAQARPILERIRLEGPFSTKALLGAGWADVAEQRYGEALGPWLALQKRDLLDSAVQESLLAIPYAYAELGAHGSAAEGYESAIAAYDAEIARIEAAMTGIRSGEFVAAVLKADDPAIGRWYWELDELPDGVEARYLYHLVADHGFQEGLRNVRDIQVLAALLDEWREKVAAFADMVATRREAHAGREPVVSASLAGADIGALRDRYATLSGRLERIAATRDVAGLATATELDQWQRLTDIGASRALAVEGQEELRERHRLLKGVLQWNLDREYRYRLWQQRQALGELDDLVARAEAGERSAVSARGAAPEMLDGFAARIAGITPRMEKLQAAITAAGTAQERRLQAMAIEVLDGQRERLAAYRVQAQFALATIYDRAAAVAQTSQATETARKAAP